MKLIKKIKTFPPTPGVYLFYDKNNRLIYVGKATNLRSRAQSYWRRTKTSRPIERMIHEITNIKIQPTDSVLEALILESNLIKKYQPIFNVEGKDDKSWQYICLTKDDYPMIKLVREHELAGVKNGFSKIFGPYTSGANLKAALKIIRRIFHYSTCQPGSKRPCLYYEMGQCLGVCVGEISPKDYRRRVINPLLLFLSGKKKKLMSGIEKRMKAEAKQENFEEAGRLKNQLKALTHIHDIALINKEFIENNIVGREKIRIEGYDISNLSGTDIVGSLVVFNEHGPIKADYRKFKIRSITGSDDIGSLKEMITRRLNRADWTLPDVFLIDGGRGQVNAVCEILKIKKIDLPVVGIAKGAQRKKNEFVLSNRSDKLVNLVHKYSTLLIQARDEAHRFAINYHRKIRNKF